MGGGGVLRIRFVLDPGGRGHFTVSTVPTDCIKLRCKFEQGHGEGVPYSLLSDIRYEANRSELKSYSVNIRFDS